MDSLLTLLLFAATSERAVQSESSDAGLALEIRAPMSDSKAAEIADWIQATAESVELVYGRFPNPRAKIIVSPAASNRWGGDSAVTFGKVTRRGTETIELFINPDRPIEEFYADWTATHELSHLMLPLLERRSRWISEGFATYYQNVLMARSGNYTQEFAWQRLLQGFERGRESRPELSPNDAAAAGVSRARMKLYWSGAALALLADTELRRRSDGQESLDSVLGELQACCLPSRRTWSGRRLLQQLDSFLEAPVFMPLYEKHANTPGFPDVTAALADIGVEATGGGVRFQADAPDTAIRLQISARR